MRALNANFDESEIGILTQTPGQLNAKFFKNLLSMQYQWEKVQGNQMVFEGKDRQSQEVKWKASRADLIFGSNSELRALAEVYSSDDAQDKFVQDFVNAWVKVMNLDRFDI